MQNRRGNFYKASAISLVVLIALLVIANLLSGRFDLRLDLTRHQVHTVSAETEEILDNLQERLTIQYYVSEEMPAGLQNARRDTIDYLQEFVTSADSGLVSLEVIDPYQLIDAYVKEEEAKGEKPEAQAPANPFLAQASTPADEKKQELARQGIPELQGRSFKDDKFEIAPFYSAIVLKYLDRENEVIPQHISLEGFEYELASRILKLSSSSKPKIAFFHGRPEDVVQLQQDPRAPGPPTMSHFQPFLVQVLGERFDVVEVSLSEESTIPEDTALLIVAEPNGTSDRQRYEIERFISSGRPAIIMASGSSGTLDTQMAITPLQPGLEETLKAWGVTLGSEIVASVDCGSIEIVNRNNPFNLPVRSQAPLPTCPAASASGLNSDSPLTRTVRALVFPYASALSTDAERLGEQGIELVELARTSDSSWLNSWRPNVTREMVTEPTDPGRLGSHLMALMLNGKLPSTFAAGDPLPPWTDPGAEGGSEEGTETPSGDLVSVVAPLEVAESQVVIVSCADFAKVQSLQLYQQNISFLLASVEALALGGNLVKIRGKNQVLAPLRTTEKWERNLATYGNLMVLPLLVVLVGLGFFLKRRSHAQRLEEEYLAGIGKNSGGSDEEEAS